MSRVLINQYYASVHRAAQFDKSRNETVICNYTLILLNAYAHKKNYKVVPDIEWEYKLCSGSAR